LLVNASGRDYDKTRTPFPDSEEDPMRLLSKNGRVRLATGAILGLLLSVAVAPSKAAGSCGDYAQRGTKSHGQAMKMSDRDKPTIPERTKFPCSGPNCSRGSQSPVLPIPTAPPSPNQWAMEPSGITLSDREPILIDLSRRLAYPAQISFSIFHPPRIAPS
jgi:hypothetical protein